MKYLIIGAIGAMVAACTPEQIIIREPVEVKIPIPVPCITTVPTCPASILDSVDFRGKTMYEKTQAVLQDVEQYRACIREKDAILTKCAEPTK